MKPGAKYRPKAAQNGHQERGNLIMALHISNGAGGQAVCHDEVRWGKKPTLWCNATDMLTYPRFVGG